MPGAVRGLWVALVASMVTITIVPAVSAAAAASPGVPPAASRAPKHPGSPHIMPFNQPGRGPALNTSSAPAGAHLTYNGGRVVSNVQVVKVIYGSSGSYLPQTLATSTPSVATFFNQVTNSPYFDWLTEYNTNLSSQSPRTNQTIGRGTYAGSITITPSAANNGSTIQDANVQSEITAQIQAGHLPAPVLDGAGNTDTLYEVFFRHGQSICSGGSCSLVAGGFCAYHGTVPASSGVPEYYYSVEPDLTGVSGCGSSTDYNNTTSVASHEMIETVTDAEVGIATNASGPPLAWYDQVNGEIGDICNGQQGTITGADGINYTVQKQFSNTLNDCIVSTAPAPANDFSISASPASLTLGPNAAGTSTISTAVTAGSTQTITLSTIGVPAGATASFNPASITSGGSATLTLNSGSASPGSYSVTIVGSGTSATHSTTLSLTVTSPVATGVTNGGFEAGSLAGWTVAGTDSVVSSGCHGGTYCAQAGSTSPTNGDSTIAQTFVAPTGSSLLSFWYKMTCPDTITYDWASATLKDATAGTTSTPLAKICTTNAWTQVSTAITAGHTYTLTLLSHDDNYAGDPTYTLFDDVVTGSAPPPPPSGITNGGFEAGSLAGWSVAGTDSVVSSGCHSGTWCAQAGSTSPTNGSSTIAQTFTAPAGSSRLTFWYKMTCPDTITYDWASATLKDNTAGTTTTPLAKVCTTNAWTQVSVAITAGHSYTLTLLSHDDNYPGDPTYTLYDDVATS